MPLQIGVFLTGASIWSESTEPAHETVLCTPLLSLQANSWRVDDYQCSMNNSKTHVEKRVMEARGIGGDYAILRCKCMEKFYCIFSNPLPAWYFMYVTGNGDGGWCSTHGFGIKSIIKSENAYVSLYFLSAFSKIVWD